MTKIQFSPSEMDLMCNAGIILTKNNVLKGIRMLLEELEADLLKAAPAFSKDPLLMSILQPAPRISKGEQYQGLPYLILDYPRKFNATDIFAIRNLFWWGHEFSGTLHISGTYKEQLALKIENSYAPLAENGYHIGVNEDPWQHHFETDNYRLISEMKESEFRECCHSFNHLKISRRFLLREVPVVKEGLLESWNFLLKICLQAK